MTEAAETVLDASALIAVILQEPGADTVIATLANAVISTVNLGECVAKLIDLGMPEAIAWTDTRNLVTKVIDYDVEAAHDSAMLRPATRSAGLSFGDRACLALARQRGATALTADRSWKKLKLGIAVTCIR